ncbi:uncharacterized protein [Montipora capricornis]|uniref:uncharacterized protein isoform X4 n=1 Tax=Montipora capricornis TaxID=246305 RepID=UPI0035F21B0A
MSVGHAVQDLSFPVKVYVGLIHLLLLFLAVLFLQRPYKKRDGKENPQQGRKSRTITRDNRAVTIESCQWVNSTLAWFYMHARTDDRKDLTPSIVKLWIRALNKQLQKDRKKNQRIVIDSLSSGCLPPQLTSVYCLSVSGNMQCITFHVESADLGFLIRVFHQTNEGPKMSHLEARVVKLTGEVALQLSTAPSKLEISVQFIGIPEIIMSTKCLTEGSEVDTAEVQEKVKEVICKTITSIPLTDATSRERLNSDVSSSSKDKLDSPSSVSCVGEEGKLLVKVIKASGLCGKDKTGAISPYCIISTSNPLQRKRTSMVSDTDSPFWNEYFTFDITHKTKEIVIDIYNYEQTEKDDYLGQVIVPLSTVNRDQTCRLILPVLPKSSKSEHSKGDISLEFTFDKDGKVIDATLPVVSGLAQNGTERLSAQSSPTEEAPSVHTNAMNSGVLNGHVSTRKRYIESSLDELAMEIEAYEHGEEVTPKENGYHRDTHVTETYEEPEPQRESVSPPVSLTELEAEPSFETLRKDEDELEAIAELIKSTEEEVEEGKKEDEKEEETKETGDESKETHDEGQGVIEVKEKEDEVETAKEPEEKDEEPSLKAKHRRSFNLFKRRKVDKKAEETGVAEDEAQGIEKKEETVQGESEQERKEIGEDKKEEEKTEVGGEDNEQNAKEDEIPTESETKPKPRRTFKLFKKKQQAPIVEVETPEDVEKEELAVDGKDEKKESEEDEIKEDAKETEGVEDKAKEVKESAEQDGEFDRKPKARRSLNLFKKRPQSAVVAVEVETQEEATKESVAKEIEKDAEPKEGAEGDEDKTKECKETAEEGGEFDRKPKARRSFNLFKKRPLSAAAAAAVEVETQEEVKKEEPVEEKEMAKDSIEETKELETGNKKDGDVSPEKHEGDKELEKEEKESAEVVPEFDAKPKLRRSFNMFKRRPQSMAAADRKTNGESEHGTLSRNDPVRHSYHAGDLPVPETSNLRKSTSQSSLLSYSPNPHSTLVIETISKGQKKYSHIPPLMAKRGVYEKGNKLHIYNDHIFTAVHFTGGPPECAVCGKPIKGLVGKQGYQCRGCKMVTHRDCHYETTIMCSSDAVKHMEISRVHTEHVSST